MLVAQVEEEAVGDDADDREAEVERRVDEELALAERGHAYILGRA